MTAYTVVTPNNVRTVIETLAGRPLVLDTETDGLDPWTGRLRMVQLASGFEHTWIFLPNCWDAVRDILLGAQILIGHNITGFDLLWLDSHGILSLEEAEGRVLDTLHLAHYRDNCTNRSTFIDNWDESDPEPATHRYVGHGLKDLAVESLGAEADSSERQLQVVHNLPDNSRSKVWAKRWALIPDDDPHLLQYAADDCSHVWRLLPELRPREGEVPLLRAEARVGMVAAKMRRRGYRVDLRQLDSAREGLAAELDVLMSELAAAGLQDLDNREQVTQYLLTEGVPLRKLTASGSNYALDKKTLEQLAKHHPAAERVHRARRLHKFLRDYIPKIAGNRGPDGRLRPSINTLGAATGRWTVTGAAPLHQMPKQGGLRECFVADPGKVLISCDYSSIEFHVLGVVTADDQMRSVSWSGEDPYLATAKIIYPDEDWGNLTPEEKKTLRDSAKPFNLGLGYGMGAFTLAAMTRLELSTATAMRGLLQQKWPGPSRMMREVERMFNRGIRRLPNLFGRVYTFPVRTDGTVLPHVAVNGLTQGLHET